MILLAAFTLTARHFYCFVFSKHNKREIYTLHQHIVDCAQKRRATTYDCRKAHAICAHKKREQVVCIVRCRIATKRFIQKLHD